MRCFDGSPPAVSPGCFPGQGLHRAQGLWVQGCRAGREEGVANRRAAPRLGGPLPQRAPAALRGPGSSREVSALPAELYYDRGNHHEFVSLVKDLARPGEVTQSQAFDFEFTHVEKPYESYTGQNVKLR